MIPFLLNLPYTLAGLVVALLLVPKEVSWHGALLAPVVRVRSAWLPVFGKNWRGAAIGHTVILNPREEPKDLAHELVHVEQLRRRPLIGPVLYALEQIRNGYRGNKYEREAYERAGNAYYGKEAQE